MESCRFCNIENAKSRLYGIPIGKLGQEGYIKYADYDNDNNDNHFYLCGGRHENVCIKLNYCPVCGRKLE